LTRRLLLAVTLALGATAARRAHRQPVPPRTWHQADRALAQTAMVLSGAADAPALPLARLAPRGAGEGAGALLVGALRHPAERRTSYRALSPIGALGGAALPALIGLSAVTLRLGPLLLVVPALAAIGGLGAQVAGGRAGRFSLMVAALLPAIYMAGHGAAPGPGIICGVALALWALLRPSESLLAGILAGALVALAPRWGESAGDGLLAASALLVPLAMRLGPLGDLRSRVGIALGLLAAGDGAWLLWHLRGYVAGEIAASGAPGLWPLEALSGGLLGPLGAAALLVAGCGLLRRPTGGWRSLALLGSAAGPLVAAGLSSKAADYYLVAAIPALAALSGPGLLAAGPTIARGAVGALGLSWLFVSHMDLPILRQVRCQPIIAATLAADPGVCAPGQRPWWGQRWRREIHEERAAAGLRAAEIAAELPAGAWVSVAPADDVTAIISQVTRPDLRVTVGPMPGAIRLGNAATRGAPTPPAARPRDPGTRDRPHRTAPSAPAE